MIVFIAGATGAVGPPLVQQLVPPDMRWSAQLGRRRSSDTSVPPTGVVVDARDSDALRRAIITPSPHVIIDQLTDLAQPRSGPGGGRPASRRSCGASLTSQIPPWASPPGLGLAGGALGGARGAASQRIRTWWAHR